MQVPLVLHPTFKLCILPGRKREGGGGGDGWWVDLSSSCHTSATSSHILALAACFQERCTEKRNDHASPGQLAGLRWVGMSWGHRPHNASASYACQSTRMIYPSTFFQKRKRNGHPPWDEWACPEATTQQHITVTSRNLETVIVIISGDYILSWSSSGCRLSLCARLMGLAMWRERASMSGSWSLSSSFSSPWPYRSIWDLHFIP